MSEDEQARVAQNVLNGAWVKGSAAIAIPFLIALVGAVLTTLSQLTDLKAQTLVLQRDVSDMRRSPAQVLEEERRLSSILGQLDRRLGRIETQIGLQSGARSQER